MTRAPSEPCREGPVPLAPMARTRGTSTTTEPGSRTHRSRRTQLTRLLGSTVVVGIILLWIFAFVDGTGDDSPDLLADTAWAARAESICSSLKATLPEAPERRDDETFEQRIARLQAENAGLRAMVADLAASAPAMVADRLVVDTWLADWDLHVRERTGYTADVVAADSGDAVFNGTAVEDVSITERMDTFATTNDMDSCQTLDGL